MSNWYADEEEVVRINEALDGRAARSDVVKFSADPDGRQHARCIVCEEHVAWPASTPVSDIADWLTRHRSHRGSA